MRKVCPKCQGAFQTQFLCPNCGVQLLEVPEHSALMMNRGGDEGGGRSVGMATRFIAGLLLAQALFYGLKLVGSGYFELTRQEQAWSSHVGQMALPGLMVATAVVGAILAGAGNPRGLASGAALGLFHALALVAVVVLFQQPRPALAVMAAWAVLPLAGAIGGRYGRYVWPPLSDIFDATPVPQAAPVKRKAKKREAPIPTAWHRVIGGAALAIGCTVWAARIREFIVGTSGGAFTVESRFQVQFVTWVISSLAVVIGGIFAGASTRAGLRHGMLVGLASCTGIFLIYTQVIKEALPAENFFAAVIGLPEESANSPARIGLFLITNSLVLSIIGGWLGAILLPRTFIASRLDRGAI